MKMSTLLTFGLWPVLKFLFGRKPRSIVRETYIRTHLKPLGNPSESKLVRVFKKVGMSTVEAEEVTKGMMRFGYIFAVDEAEGERLIDGLLDAGFKFKSELYSEELEPPKLWSEERGTYLDAVDYAYCNECLRKPTRLYSGWEGDDLVTLCSACNSQDVINPMDLSAKELEQHVKEYESLPSRSKQAGSSRSSDGESISTTATRRKYG